MSTLLRIHWLNLKRDYLALGLTFVLPIVFFSVFAAIFSGMNTRAGSSELKILAVDLDQSDISKRFVDTLAKQEGLTVTRGTPSSSNSETVRTNVRKKVRGGDFKAAVIIPAGFGKQFGTFTSDADPIEIIYDSSNPIARYSLAGQLQATAMQAVPDVLMKRGMDKFEHFGGKMTAEQRKAVDFIMPFMRGDKPWEELGGNGPGGSGGPAAFGLVSIKDSPARSSSSQSRPGSIVAYYAAGIGVMFLLFSMAGASGSLLEEEEAGTLERLLCSNVGMGTLLFGNWLFYTMIGIVQLSIMFIWGSIAFGLELWTVNHVSGFLAVTVTTSAAAAGFGLMLAGLCKTRAQLGGMSTIVILIMSALGGSMVPRFVMPSFMETTALFTFNGWALDAYLNVFWHDDPNDPLPASLIRLAPQLAVLAAMAVVFLMAARLLARRWEKV